MGNRGRDSNEEKGSRRERDRRTYNIRINSLHSPFRSVDFICIFNTILESEWILTGWIRKGDFSVVEDFEFIDSPALKVRSESRQ